MTPLEKYPCRVTAGQWFYILLFSGLVLGTLAGLWLEIRERMIFHESRIAEIKKKQERIENLLRLDAEMPRKLKRGERGI